VKCIWEQAFSNRISEINFPEKIMPSVMSFLKHLWKKLSEIHEMHFRKSFWDEFFSAFSFFFSLQRSSSLLLCLQHWCNNNNNYNESAINNYGVEKAIASKETLLPNRRFPNKCSGLLLFAKFLPFSSSVCGIAS